MNTLPVQRRVPVRRQGFSIMELIVVVAIIIGAMAAITPMVGGLMNASEIESGVNTISTAAKATRGFVISQKEAAAFTSPAEFSGVAMLFTPHGEIRLVENTEFAVNDPSGTADSLETDLGLNGFTDIPDVEPVQLPKNVGVVGLTRPFRSAPPPPPLQPDQPVQVMPPPFAVWFDAGGRMVVADNVYGNRGPNEVYYDADADGDYEVDLERDDLSSYDPDDFDPRRADFDHATMWNPTAERYELPEIEQIEVVAAVLVYDDPAFRTAGFDPADLDPNGPSTPREEATVWIIENAERIYFSRYTGQPIREGLLTND